MPTGLSSELQKKEDSAKKVTVSETTEDEKLAKESLGKQDHQLAQRAAQGDLEAFEELYKRHFRRVYALCFRMVGNVAEAEDLTQEVFTQVFNKISTFRGESLFTTWLHRLTVNLVLMHFRKSSVRHEQTTEEGETPVQIVLGTSNPNSMPIVDRIALEKAISKLPPGYRTIFVLYDVEGYDHEEIASMLGISSGTSKSQLHKARLKLREILRQQAEDK
jgi:RNA polymerase sigma-70 factor, ECF subfamily